MRKLIFAFLICFITQQVYSQGNFYIYIQSDDNKPFYVRSGSKIFQSSGNGYLVIPDLLNDTYELIVGFPENAGPEWKFTCSIAEKDLGFILKNNHTKGVELNGLKQEKGLTGIRIENKSEKKTATVKQVAGIISEDPFSAMLADVVNDPTIKQQPVIILTARDSLNMLAKAQKKDSAAATVAINNKVPENKIALTGDSAKAVAKTNLPVLAGDKKASDEASKDKKVDSTLVASSTTTDSAINNKAINNAKDVAKTTIPGIVPDKKADEKGKAGKKVDSTTVTSVTKLNDSSNNKTVAIKENKTDSTTVAAVKEKKPDSAVTDTKAVAKNDSSKNNTTLIPDAKKKTDSTTVVAALKPDLTDKKAADKTTTIVTKEKKPDSAVTDIKSVAKNDPPKNNTTLIPDAKKKTDSTAVVAASKPGLTDKTTPAINKDKKSDSLTGKAITSSTTTTPDSKAIAKNDGAKTTNTTLVPDNKKKTDSVSSAITKPATVTPPVETKKVVVVSSTSIKKTMQRKSADGIELIYVDEMSDGTKETIRILIPAEKN